MTLNSILDFAKLKRGAYSTHIFQEEVHFAPIVGVGDIHSSVEGSTGHHAVITLQSNK